MRRGSACHTCEQMLEITSRKLMHSCGISFRALLFIQLPASGYRRLIDVFSSWSLYWIPRIHLVTWTPGSIRLFGRLKLILGRTETFPSWAWQCVWPIVYKHRDVLHFKVCVMGDIFYCAPTRESWNPLHFPISRRVVYRQFRSKAMARRMASISCYAFWKYLVNFAVVYRWLLVRLAWTKLDSS